VVSVKFTKKVKSQVLLVLAITSFMSVLFWSNRPQVLHQENGISYLERNKKGAGSKQEELYAKVDESSDLVKIEVSEQAYTKAELRTLLKEVATRLPQYILGENEDLNEVRHRLVLPEQLPDYDISLSWEIEPKELLELDGSLHQESLSTQGSVVSLTATLQKGTETFLTMIPVHIYPPDPNDPEERSVLIDAAVREADQKWQEEHYLPLPDHIGTDAIVWSQSKDHTWVWLLVFGFLISGLLLGLEKQKEKEEQKLKEQALMLVFPEFIATLTLYLETGMTVRNAWLQIINQTKEKLCQKGGEKKDQKSYLMLQELSFTMHEIQGGREESLAYERFGARIGLHPYKKLSSLLAQSLKKGSKGLIKALHEEASLALEERKAYARKMGEEAGTKLLLPMFMMLCIVMVIVIYPAFVSMHF